MVSGRTDSRLSGIVLRSENVLPWLSVEFRRDSLFRIVESTYCFYSFLLLWRIGGLVLSDGGSHTLSLGTTELPNGH